MTVVYVIVLKCYGFVEIIQYHLFTPVYFTSLLIDISHQTLQQARSASSGGGADSDSICKETDVEDVGVVTPCGLPDAMD